MTKLKKQHATLGVLALLAIIIAFGFAGRQDQQTNDLVQRANMRDCLDKTLMHDARAYACDQIARR